MVSHVWSHSTCRAIADATLQNPKRSFPSTTHRLNLDRTTQVFVIFRGYMSAELTLAVRSSTVGIAQLLRVQLGLAVMIELTANRGDRLEAGESVATVEGQASVQDAPIPVSGEVTDVNDDVEGDPSLIGEGDEGWLVKVKDCMFDMELMSKDKYEEYCKSAGLQ